MISTSLIERHEKAVLRNVQRQAGNEAQNRVRKLAEEKRLAKKAVRRFKRRVRACYRRALRSYERGGVAEFTIANPCYKVLSRDNAQYMVELAQEVLPPGWRLSLADNYRKYPKNMEWDYFIKVYAPDLCPAPVE